MDRAESAEEAREKLPVLGSGLLMDRLNRIEGKLHHPGRSLST